MKADRPGRSAGPVASVNHHVAAVGAQGRVTRAVVVEGGPAQEERPVLVGPDRRDRARLPYLGPRAAGGGVVPVAGPGAWRRDVARHDVSAEDPQQRGPVPGSRAAFDQRRVLTQHPEHARGRDRPGEQGGELAPPGRQVEHAAQPTRHGPGKIPVGGSSRRHARKHPGQFEVGVLTAPQHPPPADRREPAMVVPQPPESFPPVGLGGDHAAAQFGPDRPRVALGELLVGPQPVQLRPGHRREPAGPAGEPPAGPEMLPSPGRRGQHRRAAHGADGVPVHGHQPAASEQRAGVAVGGRNGSAGHGCAGHGYAGHGCAGHRCAVGQAEYRIPPVCTTVPPSTVSTECSFFRSLSATAK